jgi:hypothetical protein
VGKDGYEGIGERIAAERPPEGREAFNKRGTFTASRFGFKKGGGWVGEGRGGEEIGGLFREAGGEGEAEGMFIGVDGESAAGEQVGEGFEKAGFQT